MTFWISVLMLVGIAFFYVQKQVSVHWQSYEQAQANAPDFVIPEHLTQGEVLQRIDNTVNAGFMMYQISIFAIILVTLVLNRNHGDQFYEIEKAAGVSPLRYTLGRIAAVMTISLVTLEIFAFFSLQAIIIGSGGVEGQSVLQTVAATFPRMTWIVLGVGIPHLCFYVGLTYLFGTLFKNGLVGAVAGFVYDIFHFVTYLLYRYESGWMEYFDMYSQNPRVLRFFVSFVGTEREEMIFPRYGVTPGRALLSAGFLIGVGILCVAVSCWLTRRREA